MIADVEKPPTEWPRYLSGFAVIALNIFAFFMLAGGLLSQVVLFGDYGQHVKAELQRPLIVPGLVAMVAAIAAGVGWRKAFVSGDGRTSPVAALIAVGVVSLLVGAVLAGPTEGQLERRWAQKLTALTLPPEFTPRTGARSADEYEVTREWTTSHEPEAVCDGLVRALEAWLGAPINRTIEQGCYLSGAQGDDRVDTYFHIGTEPGVLSVRMSFDY